MFTSVERRVRRAMERDEWGVLVSSAKTRGERAANVRGKHGKTPLHHAAFKGKLAVCGVLLDQGGDVNAASALGASPLHAAARANRPLVVALLCRRGADVDARDLERSSPLHDAAWRGNEAAVKALLDAGASPVARNIRGERPVDLVRKAPGHDPVRELLEDALELHTDEGSYFGSDAAAARPHKEVLPTESISE